MKTKIALAILAAAALSGCVTHTSSDGQKTVKPDTQEIIPIVLPIVDLILDIFAPVPVITPIQSSK